MRDVEGEKNARQGWAEQPSPDERHTSISSDKVQDLITYFLARCRSMTAPASFSSAVTSAPSSIPPVLMS